MCTGFDTQTTNGNNTAHTVQLLMKQSALKSVSSETNTVISNNDNESDDENTTTMINLVQQQQQRQNNNSNNYDVTSLTSSTTEFCDDDDDCSIYVQSVHSRHLHDQKRKEFASSSFVVYYNLIADTSSSTSNNAQLRYMQHVMCEAQCVEWSLIICIALCDVVGLARAISISTILHDDDGGGRETLQRLIVLLEQMRTWAAQKWWDTFVNRFQ
jgi:hypothetical protein